MIWPNVAKKIARIQQQILQLDDRIDAMVDKVDQHDKMMDAKIKTMAVNLYVSVKEKTCPNTNSQPTKVNLLNS